MKEYEKMSAQEHRTKALALARHARSMAGVLEGSLPVERKIYKRAGFAFKIVNRDLEVNSK